MATKKKMLQAAAGNAGGGAGLNVEDVFSTYLYTGTGSTQTITTNINTSDEGGMIWIKNRDGGDPHVLFDTERGSNKSLTSNTTDAEVTDYQRLTSFRDDGFRISTDPEVNASNGDNYASWTFRKAPKFFDVVTYSGTGSAQNISHNLGSVPGMIIVKQTDVTNNWMVQHRAFGGSHRLQLNSTDAAGTTSSVWNNTDPTSTVFTVGAHTSTNASGGTYVAYLFAHHDGDGEFGADGDADIIKCGSYTGNGTSGHVIDIGFEAQWVIVKRTDGVTDWILYDAMRGLPSEGNGARLEPNTSDAEDYSSRIGANSQGFSLPSVNDSCNQNNANYIYIAIRRGTKVPESGTEVFMPVKSLNPGSPAFISGFPVDMSIHKDTTGGATINGARLIQNKKLSINTTAAEGSGNDEMMYDFMNGFYSPLDYGSPPGSIGSTNFIGWQWKRAPGYFDAVAYTGNGTAGRTVSHNLTVAPEMMWIKCRSNTDNWAVYHKDVGPAKVIYLNSDLPSSATTTRFNNVNPTNSVFTLGTDAEVNGSSRTYIAYLFASLPGISKVGSFNHTSGTTQNIDCGFSSGARFVLVKQYASSGSWFVYDTERGIVSGIDSRLKLDSTAAENTGNDNIDPYSAGFTLTTSFSGGSYIFYAIA